VFAHPATPSSLTGGATVLRFGHRQQGGQRTARGRWQVDPLISSGLAVLQDNDRVRSTDIPCPRCGELLLVEQECIPTADQSEPVSWAIQGSRWCWNGCSFTAGKIH
jgi:hypothetical protein